MFKHILQDPICVGHQDQRFSLPSFRTRAAAHPQGTFHHYPIIDVSLFDQ